MVGCSPERSQTYRDPSDAPEKSELLSGPNSKHNVPLRSRTVASLFWLRNRLVSIVSPGTFCSSRIFHSRSVIRFCLIKDLRSQLKKPLWLPAASHRLSLLKAI